jgi:Mg-chelatase subunit ChlD
MQDKNTFIALLDRSGSMQTRRADHEGGLRSFVAEARQLTGDVRMTFIRFDSNDPFEIVFENKPVAEIDDGQIELVPRGGTPLLDAVGKTIARYKDLDGPVIMMIITDGEENESREWGKDGVQKAVKEVEAKGWKILYLGANVDEFYEASSLGLSAKLTAGYANTPRGTSAMYAATVSNVMTTARLQRQAGVSWAAASQNLAYTDEQRTKLKEESE